MKLRTGLPPCAALPPYRARPERRESARSTHTAPPYLRTLRLTTAVRRQNWLLLHAKPGEWAVPEGVRHVQSPLQVATEIIRANIFRFCKEELPYLIAQVQCWTHVHAWCKRSSVDA